MPRIRGKDKYVTAGVRMVPNQSVQIRGNVYLPGGEMCERAHSDVFCAQDSEMAARRKKHYVMNTKAAVCLLAVLVLVFGGIIAGKAIRKSVIKDEIGMITSSLDTLIRQNRINEQKLDEARDTSKICYKAVHELGMINRMGKEAVYIMLDGQGGYIAQRGVNSYGLQASNK